MYQRIYFVSFYVIQKMYCEAVYETPLPGREDELPLPSRGMASTTSQNGSDYHVNLIRGDDSQGKVCNTFLKNLEQDQLCAYL